MWMIGIGLGIILLVVGFLVKERRLRRVLLVLGAVLLAAGLIYGGLVGLLLGGIVRTGERKQEKEEDLS